MRSRRSYGGILRCMDGYVVVRGRATGKWSFPKGHWNVGESGVDCARREIKEETGLCVSEALVPYARYGGTLYYMYEMEEEYELCPLDKKEIMDARWVSLEELRGMYVNKGIREFLESH